MPTLQLSVEGLVYAWPGYYPLFLTHYILNGRGIPDVICLNEVTTVQT
jgi:hypothetical protein